MPKDGKERENELPAFEDTPLQVHVFIVSKIPMSRGNLGVLIKRINLLRESAEICFRLKNKSVEAVAKEIRLNTGFTVGTSLEYLKDLEETYGVIKRVQNVVVWIE